jgi:hypothetical protein
MIFVWLAYVKTNLQLADKLQDSPLAALGAFANLRKAIISFLVSDKSSLLITISINDFHCVKFNMLTAWWWPLVVQTCSHMHI